MSEQNYELAMAIADSPRIVREEIARLRDALADARAAAKEAMTELSSLTIAQQACIGCTGDGYDSFGMRCSGPPPIEASKNQPAVRERPDCGGSGRDMCGRCRGTGKEPA